MSSSKKQIQRVLSNKMSDNTSKKPNKFTIITSISAAISVVAAIVTVCTPLYNYVFNHGRLAEKVDNLADSVSEIKVSISEIEKNISDITNIESSLSAKLDATEKNLDTLTQVVFAYRPTNLFATAITRTYSEIDSPYSSEIISVGSTEKIVYSQNLHGQFYTATQLAEQPLLLPYTENGKEIYFYGQVDQSGSWDGHCIVNVYKGDSLILITDAEYNKGVLLNFQQVFPDSLPNGDNIWSISNRTMKDNFSEGETWRYFRDSDCKKTFTLDSVTADDIISANQFEKEFVVQEEGYYYGHVANGSYNDDTDHAYYVQYFRDGTVKTLYVGRFVDGKFDDSTGEAWMLGKITENAPYSYYKGVFQAGKSIKDSKYWEEPLSLDRVREIVASSGLTFNCTLKWERDKL